MSATRKYRSTALIALLILVLGLMPMGPFGSGIATAASADILISQVYGGGGLSGATYKNDYIELFNRGTTAISVAGWSVQYASATGSSWSKTNLTGTIQPGKYFLVKEAGGSTGATLPAAQVTGTINLSNTTGKVALVTNQTALTCGATTNNCFPNGAIRDFVGYGTANNYEGAGPVGTLSATTAAKRGGNGCTETDSNSADFAVATPSARNSSSAANPCGGGGGGTRIRDIQGKAHISPMNGVQVSGVPGVVTAKKSNGFWLQDPSPDADPATSEGIFVFTSSAPSVNVGDSITLGGTVSETRPSNTATNLTVTQISSPTITVGSTGNALPAATVVGSGGRIVPPTVIDDDATGSVETSGLFEPATDGIDFWESLEGMRVQINTARVVGPRSKFNEIPVVPDGSGLMNARGGITIRANDFNPERILLDDIMATMPAAKVGDVFPSLVGVVDYSFGNFKLLPTATPTVTTNTLAPEVTASPTASQLVIATINVENLDPLDPQTKFDGLASLIVNNLKSPDLLGVQEIQDNDGPADNGVVAADQTWTKLINAITVAGGPTYQYRNINPTNGADGGEPGGNIRQGFLFRTDRGLSFVDRAGGTATAANAVVSGPNGPELKYSPGRIDPANSAFNSSRKPLAAEFLWGTQRLFIVNNHFNSKGGDQPLFGVNQPPVLSSETQRHNQATIVNSFIQQIASLDPNAKVVVMGDLNDFQFSQTVSLVKGTLLSAPIDTLPEAERYSYNYEGNAQALDHILVSSSLYGLPWEFDLVHVNSDYEPVNRLSDHDPSVMRITLP